VKEDLEKEKVKKETKKEFSDIESETEDTK